MRWGLENLQCVSERGEFLEDFLEDFPEFRFLDVSEGRVFADFREGRFFGQTIGEGIGKEGKK